MNELTLRLVKITTHSHYSLNAHTSIIVSSLSFLLCCQKTNPKNSRACNSPLSSRNSYIQLKPTGTEAHCIVLSRCFVEFGFVCFTFVLFDSWQLTGFLGACFPNHRTDFFSLLKHVVYYHLSSSAWTLVRLFSPLSPCTCVMNVFVVANHRWKVALGVLSSVICPRSNSF